MEQEDRTVLHKKICVNLLVSVSVLLLVIFVGPWLLRFFMPFLIAWVIACIANPMVVFLEKHIRIMRKQGSFIVIVAVLVLVGILLYLLLRVLVTRGLALSKELPEMINSLLSGLQEALDMLHERYSLPSLNIKDVLDADNSKFSSLLLSVGDSMQKSPLSSVGAFTSSVLDIFVLSILTLMLSYFFVANREEIRSAFRKYTPQGIKNFWNMAKNACVRAFAGYFKACFKIMLVIFLALWLIFAFLLKIPYAWLVALITSFFDFLPFFGAGMILLPWAVYYFAVGAYFKAVVLVLSYVVSLLLHRLLEPKLVGDSVGMSPFATLLSMFIGYRLIGMWGLILGIPVGMILHAFREEGMFESQIRGIKILARDINEYRKY